MFPARRAGRGDRGGRAAVRGTHLHRRRRHRRVRCPAARAGLPFGVCADRRAAEAGDRGGARQRAWRWPRDRARLSLPDCRPTRAARLSRNQPRHRPGRGRHPAPAARRGRAQCAPDVPVGRAGHRRGGARYGPRRRRERRRPESRRPALRRTLPGRKARPLPRQRIRHRPGPGHGRVAERRAGPGRRRYVRPGGSPHGHRRRGSRSRPALSARYRARDRDQRGLASNGRIGRPAPPVLRRTGNGENPGDRTGQRPADRERRHRRRRHDGPRYRDGVRERRAPRPPARRRPRGGSTGHCSSSARSTAGASAKGA